MSSIEIIGLIIGILVIAGVLVGLTRYVTKQQTQVKLERLQGDKLQAEQVYSDLAATNKLLLDELSAARRTGAAASAKKGEVDEELASLMQLSRAGAGTVYVPLAADSSADTFGLVFLSIQPVTQQTMKLRKKIIPSQSLAGRSFNSGKPFIVANSKKSSDHYAKADQVTGYQTQDTLNLPLKYQGRVVGVLQLLNKKGGPFDEDDIAQVEQLSTRLALKVDEFSRIPDNLDVLGFVPQQNSKSATIMSCDLTASSILFQELNVSAAIQHINEYLERLCDVAFTYGATVDKYMGDGVLLRFNVPRPVDDHPFAAIKAATEIQEAFDLVKKDWITMDGLLDGLFTRIGMACGTVQKATVGHPQYQYVTVFGMPVNAATNLCDVAPRDRNVIVIDDNLYKLVADKIDAREIPGANLGKAKKYTSAAYEVLGLSKP